MSLFYSCWPNVFVSRWPSLAQGFFQFEPVLLSIYNQILAQSEGLQQKASDLICEEF